MQFLDAELKRRNLPPSALALVGFSQGTMMALHVGLRRAAAPLAIVGYSGLLVTAARRQRRRQFAAEIKSRPPVLLIHGDQDDLIPAAGAVPGDRAGSPRSASRSNGTSRTASATASTRKACATAASFWRAAWPARADATVTAQSPGEEIDVRRKPLR